MRRAALGAAAALALALPAAAQAAPTLLTVGTFQDPVFVTAPPLDTTRVMVVEQGGLVKLLKDGAEQATPFLDLRGLVTSAGYEQGLLSIAFAPDYAASRKMYAYYTAKDPAGAIQIDELTADVSGDRVDPGTRRLVLRIPHAEHDNHNGGQLQVGPDGLLWMGTGDGGSGGDPAGNGQDKTTLLGKLLRIDPRPGNGCGGGCTIPADNPFAAGGGAPEVWAYGLRNPWRFSFDRQVKDLWIGDVGQGCWEELDHVPFPGLAKGGNFEWNAREGDHAYPPPGGTCDTAGVAPGEPIGIGPILEHSHDPEGWISVTGGYVVRDPALPSLAGRYVYGDYVKGDIMSVAITGAPDERPTGLHVPALSSFGEDGCGRVYATSKNGPVYRLGESGECAGPSAPVFEVPGGGPVVPGPGAGGGADTTAPVVTLRAAGRQRLGRLRVSVRCDEVCRVSAAGRFAIRRRGARRSAATPLRTKTARASLAERAKASLRLRVSRATRARVLRALRRHRRVTVRVTVVARDTAGNRRTKRVSVRVRR